MRSKITVGLIDPTEKEFKLLKNFTPTDDNIKSLVGEEPTFENALLFEDGTFISLLRDEDNALYELDGEIINRTTFNTVGFNNEQITMLTKTLVILRDNNGKAISLTESSTEKVKRQITFL